MGMGIIVIEKDYNGEIWSNTYGVLAGTPVTSQPPLQTSDVSLIVGVAPTAITCNPTAPGYEGDTFPLHACIAFERLLYPTLVNFRRAILTNGKTKPGFTPVVSEYALGFGGLSANLPGGPAPLNSALRIIRNPMPGVPTKGELQFRGVVGKDEVIPAAGDGVGFASASTRTTYITKVALAVVDSLLGQYFGVGFGSGATRVLLGIATTFTAKNLPASPTFWGTLKAIEGISNIVVQDMMSRQVTR